MTADSAASGRVEANSHFSRNPVCAVEQIRYLLLRAAHGLCQLLLRPEMINGSLDMCAELSHEQEN